MGQFNYRKYYADYFGIEIPKEYHIHHLDRDRNNNNIRNLILLPKEVHEKVHKLSEEFSAYNIGNLTRSVGNPHIIGYVWDAIDEAYEIWGQLYYWSAARENEMMAKASGGKNIYPENYDYFRGRP